MRTLAAAAILAAIILPAAQEPDKVPGSPRSAKADAFVKEMGRGEGSLKPGDTAPDFKLRRAKSKKKIRLSSFRGKKPVALVFGSYT